MRFNWIFKSFTSRSINVTETGFASVEPPGINKPSTNVFEWTVDNGIGIDMKTEGPLIITFNKPILISKYRILVKNGRRYMKGWNISISNDGLDFITIDSKSEDFCKTFAIGNNGDIDCGEITDRIFSIPTMTIKKIKLSLTVPNSCSTYEIHINAFDVFGTTKTNEFYYSCRQCRIPSFLILLYNINLTQ